MNKKKILKISAALLLVTSFVFPNFCVVSADTQTEIKSLEKSLSSLEKDRSNLKSSINAAKAGQSSALAEKKNLDNEITIISEQISTTETLIEQYQIRQQEITDEIDSLERECSERQKMFDELFRLSFKYGEVSYLELIFGSESFADFLTRLDFIANHFKYSQTVLSDLNDSHEKLKSSRENLENSKQKLEQYKASNSELKATLDAKVIQAENTINKLKSNQSELEKMLAEADKEKAKLQAEIEELSKQIDKSQPYTGGVFLWPLPSGYTYLSSYFGYRLDPFGSGKTVYHNGLDIPAPKNTPIYAAADGTVVKAQWNGGYGNCVIINHGGGIMTLYGHCNSLNCSVGQTVKRGQTIAYVGTTGSSTGNHLHFGVYENGSVLTDPLKYLK